MLPVLYIVVPCYNEEQVLPITGAELAAKLDNLEHAGKIATGSRILFVDDGSKDHTWEIISRFAHENSQIIGIRLSRNRGHQNALLAGLMEAQNKCDITISIDCDGQDDWNAMDAMLEQYRNGCDIVYGIRSSRKSDTFFKRATARGFYRFMKIMGVETVYDHADYRLVSARVLQAFSGFREVNLFLRGMFPLVGFRSTCVAYERRERVAGKSHYPLSRMLSLALDGITSLSTRPLHLITGLGTVIALLSFLGAVWSIVVALTGNSVPGWASTVCIVCFIGGIQLMCLGIIGEYVGKIYMEVKARPRYIISEKTSDEP